MSGQYGRRSLSVDTQDAGARLDRYLADEIPEYSRTFFQSLIKDGAVQVNGSVSRPRDLVHAGDAIDIAFPEVVVPEILPQNIPLDILYEDNDIIVVNKPKGMVVHPAPGHPDKTLVNALLYHCRGNLSGINGVARPGIVHRIDKDTTGVLVAAKTDAAHRFLARQLAVHSITRVYEAIVYNSFSEETGTIDRPLGRDPRDRKKFAVTAGGRRAVTHYRVVNNLGRFAHITCQLETGRTHQIRVHMAYAGHPLLGDPLYGPSKCPYRLEGQCLHARTLGFIHPSTKQYMEFEAPLPEYFQKLLKTLGESN